MSQVCYYQKIRRQNEQHRAANPWTIANLESSTSLYGRYPTREAAVAACNRYPGGCVDVNEAGKVAYFASIPTL